jgi:hypothetical protein
MTTTVAVSVTMCHSYSSASVLFLGMPRRSAATLATTSGSLALMRQVVRVSGRPLRSRPKPSRPIGSAATRFVADEPAGVRSSARLRLGTILLLGNYWTARRPVSGTRRALCAPNSGVRALGLPTCEPRGPRWAPSDDGVSGGLEPMLGRCEVGGDRGRDANIKPLLCHPAAAGYCRPSYLETAARDRGASSCGFEHHAASARNMECWPDGRTTAGSPAGSPYCLQGACPCRTEVARPRCAASQRL